MRQDAAAEVRVVVAERLVHIARRDAEMAETVGVDEHLVLLDVAAGRVDLGDPGDRSQVGAHDPVLERAALREFVDGERPLAVVRVLERVLVDLAEHGRHRAQQRGHAVGHPAADLDEAFRDHLPCEVEVGAFGEDQRDERQRRPVQRAHLDQTRQAGHGHLDRDGDGPFHFLGRTAQGFGRDLDLDVRDVREGIDRKLADGPEAERQQDAGSDDDDDALLQRAADDRLDHRAIAACCRVRRRGGKVTGSPRPRASRRRRCPSASGSIACR